MLKVPCVAISLGCPAGIGPQVAGRAAARSGEAVRCLLIGDGETVRRAARRRRIARRRLVPLGAAAEIERLTPGADIGIWQPSHQLDEEIRPGEPSRAAGAAQLAWIDQACDLVQSGGCDALVTGPVSKEVIFRSGAKGSKRFRGHTEHLARRLGAREVIMAFRSPTLTTALVTTHLALRDVPRAITAPRVERACYWLARLLRDLGIAEPRLAVAALNPHAGEGELLGDEERRRITPGIGRARRRLEADGIPALLCGPIGAETAFRTHLAGDNDGVVAMYHDQATIPCKIHGFGESVNVTLGLPIIRTSVDHGTGYDLAGSGLAADRGMRGAIALAARLSASQASSKR